MNKRPVVIVGAGPAGLACASGLVAHGISVVIIEDNFQAGGQYFRQLPPAYRVAAGSALKRETSRFKVLAQVLTHPLVKFLPSTVVWGSPEPLTIAYAGAVGSGRVQAQAIVIATGAHDRPLPFTGWTLPGVISAGGCLNLAKAHGLVPNGRIIVAGNGPLVLVAAATTAAAGANVTQVLEAQPTSKLMRAAFEGLRGSPRQLWKAFSYRARILASGAHFTTGWVVTRADGDDRVRRVRIAPIQADGKPNHARERILECDTLVLGYGLQPSTELAGLLGCLIVRSDDLGGWVPDRTEHLETSVEGVYAIGDGAGIGGVEVALVEGARVAEAIARGDGKSLGGTYARLDRFRRALNLAYRPNSPLVVAEPDTIVCRCEELRLGELQAVLARGAPSSDVLKASSRLGMAKIRWARPTPGIRCWRRSR